MIMTTENVICLFSYYLCWRLFFFKTLGEPNGLLANFTDSERNKKICFCREPTKKKDD